MSVTPEYKKACNTATDDLARYVLQQFREGRDVRQMYLALMYNAAKLMAPSGMPVQEFSNGANIAYQEALREWRSELAKYKHQQQHDQHKA